METTQLSPGKRSPRASSSNWRAAPPSASGLSKLVLGAALGVHRGMYEPNLLPPGGGSASASGSTSAKLLERNELLRARLARISENNYMSARSG